MAKAIIFCDGWTPSAEPRSTRAAISAVILPSPQQKGEDRSVLVHILDPVSTQFAVSLVDVFLLWRVIGGGNIRPHYEVAFGIHDDNDLMSFFFFEPNDQNAMSKVVIIVPTPGDPGHGIEGVLQTASAVSTAEFAAARAQLFNPGAGGGNSEMAKFMRVGFDKPSFGSTSTQVAVSHVEWGEMAGAIPGKLIYALGPVPVNGTGPMRSLKVTAAQRTQAFASVGARPRPKPRGLPIASVRPLARVRF